MSFDNVLQMVVPAPDGQFRLKNCLCGSDQTVYLQILGSGQPMWVARCMACGKQSAEHAIQHDAQLNWNRGGAA